MGCGNVVGIEGDRGSRVEVGGAPLLCAAVHRTRAMARCGVHAAIGYAFVVNLTLRVSGRMHGLAYERVEG